MIELNKIIIEFIISGILGSIVYLSLPPIIIDDKFKNFTLEEKHYEIIDETADIFINVLKKLIIFSNYSQQKFSESLFPYKYENEIYENVYEFDTNFLNLGYLTLS